MTRSPRDNDYLLLGVTPRSTAAELLRAYRQRARDVHPDVRPDDPHAQERFLELTSAYEALLEQIARARPGARTVPVVVRIRPPREDQPPLRAAPAIVRPWPARGRSRDGT